MKITTLEIVEKQTYRHMIKAMGELTAAQGDALEIAFSKADHPDDLFLELNNAGLEILSATSEDESWESSEFEFVDEGCEEVPDHD